METCPPNTQGLENQLSEPTEAVIEALRRLDGDILILGVAGKMGPSLATMAKRGFERAGLKRKVIGVSRFTSGVEAGKLRSRGVDTIRCDLLDSRAVKELPDAAAVVYMPGFKFGFEENPSQAWAVNALVPAMICERYRTSRLVAFSTGSLYGLSNVSAGGSLETDAPVLAGEYGASCLGRERLFEYFSLRDQIPVANIRLFYACDLRYGVLVDIALRIRDGEPIDLTTGWFNIIWQGDSHAITLRLLDHVSTPPLVVNVTGPELLSTREVAERMGRRLGRKPLLRGEEAPTACLGNVTKMIKLFGSLRVSGNQLVDWVADWVGGGRETLGKPTHFEVRDGRY